MSIFEIEGWIIDPKNDYPERGVTKSFGPLKKVFFGGSDREDRAKEIAQLWKQERNQYTVINARVCPQKKP